MRSERFGGHPLLSAVCFPPKDRDDECNQRLLAALTEVESALFGPVTLNRRACLHDELPDDERISGSGGEAVGGAGKGVTQKSGAASRRLQTPRTPRLRPQVQIVVIDTPE